MIHLDVHIMGQSYRLACRDGEQRTLREAVSYLDGKMCQLRDSGKVKGTDRCRTCRFSRSSKNSSRCTRCWTASWLTRKIWPERPNPFDRAGQRSKLVPALRCSRFAIYSLNHSYA
jgi:hypothetical protein